MSLLLGKMVQRGRGSRVMKLVQLRLLLMKLLLMGM